MEMQQGKYNHSVPFTLELGGSLTGLEIAYHTYGTRNNDDSNVIWVCHALTANSDPCDWWAGLFGTGHFFDPKDHFIVCANIIGSCYGTTGPQSINPETGRPYYASFPTVTIRDMVEAHRLLQHHLGIHTIALGIGGSMGAYQLLEWMVIDPTLFQKACILATSARESAWGIGIHTAQRMAIESDPTWIEARPDAGANGLRTARAIGMLTYRNYETFVAQQSDTDDEPIHHRASSYLNHQGNKLVARFNAISYHRLSTAMDTHNIARGRGTIVSVLQSISTPTLIIGISSDILCPVSEQRFLAQHIPNSRFSEIDSPYGHDGFLVETEKITEVLKGFL